LAATGSLSTTFSLTSGAPYYPNKDDNNYLTMPTETYFRTASNLFLPVHAGNPFPTSDTVVLAELTSILAKIISAPATSAKQDTLIAKDFATQTTLAAIGALFENNAYCAGNPYVIETDCTVANTNYDIDANTALSHNGHFGFLKSKITNTGVVSVAFSYNSSTFTNFITDIQPGDSIDLDGMDIDTIRVKSTVAGDDVIIEIH